MHVSVIGFIILAEIFLVLLVGCGLLWQQNRRLRALTSRLQARMGEMASDIREYRARAPAGAGSGSGGGSYEQKLDQQLKLTRQYHREMAEGQDIALDLDVDTPLPRRVAALRYAMLVAERDALGENTDEAPNWEKLQNRYNQLMEYYAAAEDDEDAQDEEPADISQLREELETYQKRVINLERFKALYFELESRWNACREEAESHYNELSEMGAQLEDPQNFEETLQSYHQSYQGIADLVESDEADTLVANSASARAAQKATGEIRHLRNVAADQHRIIYDLQQKLAEATSKEETSELVKTLQEELDKQLRYAQESDTCIQLLEVELASAHRTAGQAQNKLKQFGLVKAELKDMQTAKENQEKLVLALKSENQRLKNKLRAVKKTPAASTTDPQLKKEYTLLQQKYADLEEKYLDLKLHE